MFCRIALAALLLAAAPACRKESRPEVERVALLPIENLTGDPQFDGPAAATGALIHSQTSGLNELFSYRVNSASDVAEGRPTQVLRGYVERSGDGLLLRAFVQDGQTGRTLRIVEARGDSAIPLSRTVATSLAAHSRPPGSTNAEAVAAWGQALAAGSADAIALLRRAVAADPRFGEARIALLQALTRNGDRAEAATVVREGLAQKTDELTAALLQQWAAGIEGKPEAQRFAVEQLARLQPADSEANRRAANLHVARRDFDKAISYFTKATRADPSGSVLWNELAYAQAYANRFDAALASIARYEALDPRGANPPDSLGDIHFMAGRFADAEKSYLESHKRDPRFFGGAALRKAAEARRMMGDLKAADAHLGKYLEAAGKSPAAEVLHARWLHDTGRAEEAVKRMESLAQDGKTPPAVASQVYAQIAVWRMLAGDRAGAFELAGKAARDASIDAARQLAGFSRFVSQPAATAVEWSERAGRVLPDPRASTMKRYMLAYALLLNGYFAEAAEVLKQLYRETNPTSDGPVRTLYAWALVESGKLEEARTVLARFAPPQPSSEGAFDCLAFPRILALKSRLSTDDARAKEWEALYRQYGGR